MYRRRYEARFTVATTIAIDTSDELWIAAMTRPMAETNLELPVTIAMNSFRCKPTKTPVQAAEGRPKAIDDPTMRRAQRIWESNAAGTLGKIHPAAQATPMRSPMQIIAAIDRAANAVLKAVSR